MFCYMVLYTLLYDIIYFAIWYYILYYMVLVKVLLIPLKQCLNLSGITSARTSLRSKPDFENIIMLPGSGATRFMFSMCQCGKKRNI